VESRAHRLEATRDPENDTELPNPGDPRDEVNRDGEAGAHVPQRPDDALALRQVRPRALELYELADRCPHPKEQREEEEDEKGVSVRGSDGYRKAIAHGSAASVLSRSANAARAQNPAGSEKVTATIDSASAIRRARIAGGSTLAACITSRSTRSRP
jgi:hypothetical protein